MVTGRIDVEALLDSVDIVDVIQRNGVSLSPKGGEFIGLCPFHNDTHPSLKVSQKKQLFACHGCNTTGNVFDFLYARNRTLKFMDVVKILQEHAGIINSDGDKKAAVAKRSKAPQWKPILPVPADAPTATFVHYQYGKASKWWKYVNPVGATMAYACRFDFPDGSKEVLPYCYATNGERDMWGFRGLPPGRPLFNLQRIVKTADSNHANGGETVVVVEGEKCAEILQALVPLMTVTCWMGGARAIKQTDWNILRGRMVVLWPDYDKPGVEAMLEIAELLRQVGAKRIMFVHPPPGSPKGWDAADGNFDTDGCRMFLRSSMREAAPVVPDFAAPPKPNAPAEQVRNPFPEEAPPPEEDVPKDFNGGMYPFSFLGTRKQNDTQQYVFFVHSSKLLVGLRASELSKSNLISLAPMNWWEMKFPNNRGFELDAAQDWLITQSNAMGIFSERRLRGRGAWREGKSTVLHVGNYLVIDGKSVALGSVQTRFIYEAGEPLHIGLKSPLATKEANRLMDVLKMINWERDINAYLLAGWCVIAPVCGALRWRPHIWITGAAGTGKSWVFQNIVRRLLGDAAMAVQGETSEAGLRQLLQHDALPVVFDEAEGEDRRSADRMDAVMALMRAASAEDGGMQVKGSAGGSANTYRIRSCFGFASIAVQIKQQSDRTRVTVLGMKRRQEADRAARWQVLQSLYVEIITEDFVRRLQARTIKMLPTILRNAEVFSAAAAALLSDQRLGDQLGAMLAGAYSLSSSSVITYDQALEWVKARDWAEERGHERTRDEVSLLNYLMEVVTRVEGAGTTVERAIGELCRIAAGLEVDALLEAPSAQSRLRRIGVRVDYIAEAWYITISSSSKQIKEMLQNTPWVKSHSRILMRLESAEEIETVRFAAGIKTRAVRIPITAVTG